MKKKVTYCFGFLIFVFGATLLSLACKNNGPSIPYDVAITPTPVRITGAVNVFVEDKNLSVPGLMVEAIPPSGVTVYSQATTTSGIASFNPPYLELGTWSFVVPAQTPFPFAPSTITMPVSVANETANFNSAGATIYLTPTVPESFTSSTPGSPYTYNLIYSQPGSLFVPGKLAFPALPNDWSASYGPATIGFTNADSGVVTISGLNCVDTQPSFAVTAMDMEPTPYPRAYSSPQTIVKSFTSTMTVVQKVTGLQSTGGCNDPAAAGAGDQFLTAVGQVIISASSACGNVTLTFNVNTCGTFSINGQNLSAGSSITLPPGIYSCSWSCWWTNPSLTANFNGHSNSIGIPFNISTNTVLNVSY